MLSDVNTDLFPYGPTRGDNRLFNSDDGQTSRQWVDHGVQVLCHRYRNFYVSLFKYMLFILRMVHTAHMFGTVIESSWYQVIIFFDIGMTLGVAA